MCVLVFVPKFSWNPIRIIVITQHHAPKKLQIVSPKWKYGLSLDSLVWITNVSIFNASYGFFVYQIVHYTMPRCEYHFVFGRTTGTVYQPIVCSYVEWNCRRQFKYSCSLLSMKERRCLHKKSSKGRQAFHLLVALCVEDRSTHKDCPKRPLKGGYLIWLLCFRFLLCQRVRSFFDIFHWEVWNAINL